MNTFYNGNEKHTQFETLMEALNKINEQAKEGNTTPEENEERKEVYELLAKQK